MIYIICATVSDTRTQILLNQTPFAECCLMNCHLFRLLIQYHPAFVFFFFKATQGSMMVMI